MSGKGSIGGGIGDGDSCNWMKMKFVRNLRRYFWRVFLYWPLLKSSKYGTGPTQEKKMTGSTQHIEIG